MSRCWDVANFCPLVVFGAGVRVVEFGAQNSIVCSSATLSIDFSIYVPRLWVAAAMAAIAFILNEEKDEQQDSPY